MTNPITGALNTIAGTAANLVSGLLYDFSIPLGLVNLIQQAIYATQSDPNTPQVQVQRAPREWYSQPSSATQGTPPMVTVFLVDGTYNVLDLPNTNYSPPDTTVLTSLSALIDTSSCVIQTIEWPAGVYPTGTSIAQGVAALTSAILSTGGPFIIAAYSQGGAVAGEVLGQLQSGNLQDQYSRLIAGVTFGSVSRQSGKYAPVQTDPGGEGAWSAGLVSNTPALWWDFALEGDLVTTLTSTGLDGYLQQVFNVIFDQYNGGDLIEFLNVALLTIATLATQPAVILELIQWVETLIGITPVPYAAYPSFGPHGEYDQLPPPGASSTLTCVQQAANYINKTADQWQAAYRFTNPTEVLQINFKLPLSIGNLGFSALRVPCVIEAWYRDRNNNWIQLTDEANNPVSLNISFSASTSWYQFQTDIYPVVGTAMQLRITRKYDPQMGAAPYVVGIKETLIQRYIYSMDDTKLAISDQQDMLGNVISSYVKNWNPNNALDNNPTTYWKSFPCPDPNGVVAYYLDTRDQSGNPQLIDTVYIDPVYTGNTLNLYYSNDLTQGTRIINSCNVPPTTQTNATWKIGRGLYDSSTLGTSNSTYTFPTSFGPMVEQPVWIGIEWTPDFAPGSAPPQNPILFGVTPATSTINAVQTIALEGNPTGGTFNLMFQGQTTAAIAYNAAPGTVEDAIEVLSNVGEGNVTVDGPAGGPWVATFTGTLGGQNVGTMTNPDNAVNLTGGSGMVVQVATTTVGETLSVVSGGTTYWPVVYYDVGAGYITLEFTNGVSPVSYHLALSPAFTQNEPLEIVVGWDYDPDIVFINVKQQNTAPLGQLLLNPATGLPANVTLDGQTGYTNFRGLMTALVVKQENWSNGYQAFQNNPEIYANPNPVQPDANGNYPSTSLDNAILAVDWTAMQMPIGGTDESWYENKVWTPIYENYHTEKGNLFLPQAVNMSFLKMEFSNLTPEPYPVYDQGIQITYDTFPVSVTQTSTTAAGGILGNIQNGVNTLLSLGSDIVTNSLGSVNWFNPQTIQNAVNANFGVTQQPMVIQSGPGTSISSLPNTTQSNISSSYRSEQSSPWIYNRQAMNPSALVGQTLAVQQNSAPRQGILGQLVHGVLSTVGGIATATLNGGLSGGIDTAVSDVTSATLQTVNNAFTAITSVNVSNVLGQIGQDWWLFPGANLKMPAAIMNFITDVETILYRPPVTSTWLRFTGNIVHRYATKTLTLDAAVGYFAGLTEVQAYATHYIAGNDPLTFRWTQYDPKTFNYNQYVVQELSGPITTSGSPYVFQNPNFLSPLELQPWTATGPWSWSLTGGLGFSSGASSALYTAAGSTGSLVSEPIAVNPGDQLVVSAWVSWESITSTSGAELSISGISYNGSTVVGNVTFAMPTTTATYTVANQAAMLALGGVTVGQSCTITGDQYQGTYILTATPASTFSNWKFSQYGTIVLNPTGTINGNPFVQLTGTYTVPGSGVNHLAVSLNVNSEVTSGSVFWDKVAINPAAGSEAIASFTTTTTSSFSDVSVKISDSGLLNSDSMWAQLDPLDTNINNLQLAPYVTTFPSSVPSGFWDDTLADWNDLNIDWGEPLGTVAISVDPNLVYNGNRAVHFVRAAGAGNAGVIVTQQTNMYANEMVQLGAVFYKPNSNSNQITILLRRVSDGVVIHTETITPVVGYWFTYLSDFFELPNTTDQVYTIEFYCSGSAADEMYLADLFCNVAGIRYLLQVGDSGAFDFDITQLAYSDNCNVSVTTPTNELSFSIGIYNPNSYAYGAVLTPRYLK